MKFTSTLRYGVVLFLLTGTFSTPAVFAEALPQSPPPSFQYFDGSYYYYGNYLWKGTWYPSGWYASPGHPAPTGYVSPSGWPTGGRSLPAVLPPESQNAQAKIPQSQGMPSDRERAPVYTYFDGRYYYYERYSWQGHWYPAGWYAAPGVPAPAGYVSPTGWRPNSQVPPYAYYDGTYYYYPPYFWGGIAFAAGWYVSLGVAAPIGYLSPSGWYFGIASPLPVPLFFDGIYYYYPRYFWGGRWFAPGWYTRPGRPGPSGYHSPTGWKPGLDPSRFRPVPRPHPTRPLAGSFRRPIRSPHGGARERGGRSHRRSQ